MAFPEFETALAAELTADGADFLTEQEWTEHVLYSMNKDLCVRLWREGVAITPDTIKENW